jgi:hypothetical protein
MKNEIEIVKWIYFTGKFLNYFDNKKDINCVKKSLDLFLINEGFSSKNTFHTFNQGTIMMLLYGLLVYPKELWTKYLDEEKKDIEVVDAVLFEKFDFKSIKSFNILIPNDQNIKKTVFLRRMRNAIAHSQVRLDIENNKFCFWNQKKLKEENVINFSVEIDKKGICEFINELSEFFINNVENNII